MTTQNQVIISATMLQKRRTWGTITVFDRNWIPPNCAATLRIENSKESQHPNQILKLETYDVI